MSPVLSLPPMPTRAEVAAYCNASGIRIKKITARTVKGWQDAGWLRKHPAYDKPARYIASEVLDFLDGKTNARRAR